MMKTRSRILLFPVLAALIISCRADIQQKDIVETILSDRKSFYFIDFSSYPDADPSLPIGIFDSGTGGLTVLKSMLDYDGNVNETHASGSDGIRDFQGESFLYFGDLANMPYGNYAGEDNLELLREHVIKDAQFLMGHKYYADAWDKTANRDKQAVKAIVIGCNTATAYGLDHLEEFISRAGIGLKVIGVIEAGAAGALERISKDEDAIIGVMATAGTVDSRGYDDAIADLADELGYRGHIEVFSQGGIGIAEAVDGDADYLQRGANEPYPEYKGPGLTGEQAIKKELLEAYNFEFSGGKMLCDDEDIEHCTVMQINDAENYVRYHLVSLMEQIRRSRTKNKLKVLILGCTHYPYLAAKINRVLGELYDFRTRDGAYRYREYLEEDLELIDPAENTSEQLYEYLADNSFFNPAGDLRESEFYISVPNRHNPEVRVDSAGRFPYAYKYGRTAGEIQEYVKVVPFSRKNLSEDVLRRIQVQMPHIYMLIRHFNNNNPKTITLKEEDRI
jgi:glutamate racemase